MRTTSTSLSGPRGAKQLAVVTIAATLPAPSRTIPASSAAMSVRTFSTALHHTSISSSYQPDVAVQLQQYRCWVYANTAIAAQITSSPSSWLATGTGSKPADTMAFRHVFWSMRGHSTCLSREHPLNSAVHPELGLLSIDGYSSGITHAAWAVHLASELANVVRNARSVIVIAKPVATGSTVTVPTCDHVTAKALCTL